MGQLIVPTDQKISGPWLLDSKALEDLAQIFHQLNEKLEKEYQQDLEKAADDLVAERHNLGLKMTLEEARSFRKETYPYKDHHTSAMVFSKDEQQLRDIDLKALLRDPKLNTFAPTKLEVVIDKGRNRVKLEITSEFSGGKLAMEVRTTHEGLFGEINFEVCKWLDNHKPSWLLEKWATLFPFLSFPLLVLTGLISLFAYSSTNQYQQHLKNEAHQLLKDSLSHEETRHALELLLSLQSDYVPSNFGDAPSHTNTSVTSALPWIALTLIILAITPKTVIGVGRKKGLYRFYKWWTYVVLVFIPVLILLPVIRSKFL